MAATTNKWINARKNADILAKLDEALMNGWANDASLADVIRHLPKDVRDFVLQLKFNTPIIDDSKIELTLNIGD
jgi:hypothetical protein